MAQYEALKQAIVATGIPVAEYDWQTRPTGNYCTMQLDFQAGQESYDNVHGEIIWQGSIDLYTKGAGMQAVGLIENALESVCGAAWKCNAQSYDSAVRMIHREYVFEVV